jgi:hypothetical protein
MRTWWNSMSNQERGDRVRVWFITQVYNRLAGGAQEESKAQLGVLAARPTALDSGVVGGEDGPVAVLNRETLLMIRIDVQRNDDGLERALSSEEFSELMGWMNSYMPHQADLLVKVWVASKSHHPVLEAIRGYLAQSSENWALMARIENKVDFSDIPIQPVNSRRLKD